MTKRQYLLCRLSMQLSFVSDRLHDQTAFIQEHALKIFCMETTLEQITFAEKEIINIQSAVVEGLKITLSFGNDQICIIKKLTGF